ncbi:hypothetical protein EDB92DRAFT_2108417 [Lactarius akahatsu]|uniref:Uncharacterized protein n=1 Tax=Lactarius akahatsu TaxID=416441 RepID=A0AAD4L2T9_9AGAM|nr:hypothetical protein EDB92DRAFT_2108417 [Lactarius akahatsu]
MARSLARSRQSGIGAAALQAPPPLLSQEWVFDFATATHGFFPWFFLVMWVPVTGNVVTHRGLHGGRKVQRMCLRRRCTGFGGCEAAQRLRPRLCRIAKAARECRAVGKGSSGCGEVGNRNIGLHGALLVWVVAGDCKRSRTLARDTKICRGGRRGRQHVKLESLRPREGAARWGRRGGESELCETCEGRRQPKAESV